MTKENYQKKNLTQIFKTISLVAIMAMSLLLPFAPVHAQNNSNSNANAAPSSNNTGRQSTYTVEAVDFDEPVGGRLRRLIDSESVPGLLIRFMKILMILLGTVAVIVILIGAFRMVTSQGNAEAVKSAKSTITWAVVGVVTALLSYSIVAILQSFLGVQ